jgi:hypothetical protein
MPTALAAAVPIPACPGQALRAGMLGGRGGGPDSARRARENPALAVRSTSR